MTVARPPAPAPNTPERYGGFDPKPLVQAGADVRMLFYFPQDERIPNSAIPMQTDLYVAASPYNPDEHNKGRLTLLMNAGCLGSRSRSFDDFFTRFFLREYFAMYHDLPYNIYAKVGQFLPTFGWRIDDHTSSIRGGLSFDNERQVFGAEVGINPNYFFAHASLYAPGPDNRRGIPDFRNRFTTILTKEDQTDPLSSWKAFNTGVGTSLQAGWRDFDWQAFGSFVYESREGVDNL